MKSCRALLRLYGGYPRTGKLFMSTDAPTTRPDVRKLLCGTSNFEAEAENDQFVSSAYHVDKGTLTRMEREVRSREKINPQHTSVILFPGQGAQYPGMTKKLKKFPVAKEMFNYASEVMKFDLLKLCCEGPEKMLSMTINCQAAVLVTSLAALEKLKHDNPHAVESCAVTAGFSVGEYAALVFAGALTFEEAVQVVKLRSDAMQCCAQERRSGLLITLMSREANINYAMRLAREWCQQKEGIEEPVCEIANYLSQDYRVIGGDLKALQFLIRNRSDLGIQMAKPLRVSGAFHTRLMDAAKNVVKKALAQVQLKTPSIEVISNVTSKAYRNPEAIRGGLIKHVVEPVKWEQTMHHIYTRDQGEVFPKTYEVGPGSTLRPLLKRMNQKAYETSQKFEFE